MRLDFFRFIHIVLFRLGERWYFCTIKISEMRRVIVIVLVMFPWLSAVAQQQLTLSQCRYLATQSNPTLKAAQERIDAARALEWMAFCQFLPKLF